MTDRQFEAIAVVGIGCRLPGGADSAERYWDLLCEGRDTSGPAPADRWRSYADRGPSYAAAARRAVPYGHFLDGVADFDAEFFGLSPREAELMDPQQRLVMETAWEALEHAGIPAGALAGTDAGVYVGVCTGDYGHRLLEDLPDIEAWTGIGSATCAVANRVSYALDLRGPSMAVDTACSASLVAVHLAVQALRSGETDLALAGGVNLILSPGETLTLDAAGTLAPDGRSKSFDAAADGYGRGEGAAVVVLKRLGDAVRDGDVVLATILGSAVNQDGHTAGIMAPCGAAQEHVMRRALRQAGVDPGTVGYVEAHGTGTAVGDPLEAAALAAVYGAGREPERPCLIGSAKSNIGHLEGAAGVAGLVKAVLAVHRGEIPPSRLDTPTPAVDWAAAGLRVADRPAPWPEAGHPRRAAVSAFGYGGTVAHVVLEQGPPAPAPTGGAPGSLFPVSAASRPALRQAAADLAAATGAADAAGRVSMAELGHTLALRRTHLSHRAVVVADNEAALAAGLRNLAAGTPHDAVATGRPLADPGPGPVFVFSGHGSQWAGMGRDLLAAEPAFAAVIDELEPVFAEEIGFSPREALSEGELTEVDRVQTMIFAMQVGLVEVWRQYGVRPHAVIGHSVGEIAAAVTAGALSRLDGARLICRRSRLLRRVAGRGAMAMAQLPFAEAERRLAGRPGVVAAIASSPGSTVVSGDPDAVAEVLTGWLEEGIPARRVASDVAFHGPQMDPLMPDLAAAAAGLTPRAPGLAVYSTALDDPRGRPGFDGAYWAANLRRPVRLAGAVAAAAADGYRAFVEISAHPVVTHSVLETLGDGGYEDVFVGGSLRRNRPGRTALLTAVAAAHCAGLDVDWRRLQPSGGPVTLPAYPWQRRTHWRPPSPPDTGGRGHDPDTHTLLGDHVDLAGTDVRLWRTALDDHTRPYPGSHAIEGVEIVPAAVLTATFLAAAGAAELGDVTMSAPLLTADRREIQVVRQGAELRLAARLAGERDAAWQLIATAAVPAGPAAATEPRPRPLAPADPGLVGSRLAAVGVPDTGFDWSVEELLLGDGAVRARVRCGPIPPGASPWTPVLDAAMSVAPSVFPGDPLLRMVTRIDRLVTSGEPQGPVTIEVLLDHEHADTAQVRIIDEAGTVVGRLSGLRYPVIDAPAPGGSGGQGERPADSFAHLEPEELRTFLVEEVGAQIAKEMRLAPGDLEPHRPLIEQGLDSVMTVVVRRRLEQRFRCSLPATLLWAQPTVAAVAAYIAGVLSVGEPPNAPGHGGGAR
ncbi:Phthiocerol/phenolphthiocerol synthesis polyketide synthase type I PpsA [Nonomuraea coxensis DSM 45129]|uniref:Phthiocerol/phenolphthiocerol synthesis polyketide synthase type I PpsA n=1 Tax=Nonomuraea coxensis DSM 45129 TaxID=1122611 RepID=A0ABX8TXC2_9ACTN|nr:type I polyketide synthase [Nonomuraea coxensis]QYC40146.1 Phthiocerol/phenolphthiocerol synthesis polyketide synthase type I PpsA [Nonomuraea coxensis DSM 45129]